MLRNAKDLDGLAIGATDGAVGRLVDFYFDDQAWVVRYLVVEAGAWLAKRKVLISPIAVTDPDWASRLLSSNLTKGQIESSPDIDTDMPVSRQHEMEYHTYFGNSYYWGGGGLWGEGDFPNLLSSTGQCSRVPSAGGTPSVASGGFGPGNSQPRNADPHLRSRNAVVGYQVRATDGAIGHIDSLLLDDKTWAVRYIVVDTSNWWVGHKVLIAPPWIEAVRWSDSTVSVNVTREAVKFAPAYDDAEPLDRAQETALHTHHDRPGYWSEANVLETDISRV
jgi:hypothetical protein